jgi:hypothetical protein
VKDVYSREEWGVRTIGLAVAAALLVVTVVGAIPARAQCSDGSACVVENGDNETDIDIEENNQGGDASAGSQIIGGAGVSGNVDITANNDSEFSTAQGGDATSKTVVEGQSGTTVVNEGSTVNVTSDATSESRVTQTARPRVRGDIDQVALPPDSIPATGESVFSSTVTASLDAGVSQDASVDSSPEATSIAAGAVVLPTIVHEGRNKVSLKVSGSAVSGDAVAGGQVISVVAVTGETRIVATNRSTFATARSGDAAGKVGLVASSGPQIDVGESQLSVSSGAHDSVTVAQLAAPESTFESDGANVNVSSSSPVTQFASVQSAPTAVATAGEQTVSGTLIHEGDNEVDLESDVDLVAGDAVAGSQVIALAGVQGNVVIEANNSSRFARATGGDAELTEELEARSGPRLEIGGTNTHVEAVAMGATGIGQTATPNVTLDVTSSSPGSTTNGDGVEIDAVNLATVTGSAPVMQSATAVVQPSAVASSDGNSSALATVRGSAVASQSADPTVSIIINQATTPVVNGTAPVLTIDASNTATLSGSAPVQQTADLTASPSAGAG